MKAVKYLFALWAAVLIYASLSFISGAGGLSAFRQLERERIKQEENIEALKQINRELEDTMYSLLYDKDTLAVYARELGFASGQEQFIRIVGLGMNQKAQNSAGEVLVAAEPQYTQNRTIRIIAFCTGITTLLCMALFDALKYLRDRA